MERSKTIRWMLTIFSIGIFVSAILFYKFIFSYLFVGFITAYLIAPLIKYAETRNVSRTTSILITYLILAVLIVIIFNVIIPQLVNQAVDLSKLVKQFLEQGEALSIKALGIPSLTNFVEQIQEKFPQIQIDKQLKTFLDKDKINDIVAQLPLFFQSLVNILAFVVVIPVIVFFMLKDERLFIKTLFSNINNRYFEFSLHLWEEIEASFGKFFRALLLETILVAFMSIVGLLILGIPNAIILGLIVGLANPIKYFGPFIGAIPTLLVIILGPTPDIFILYAIIMFIIVQQIDSLILFPWLIGKSMNMHPLWVLLTVIAGGYAFGILGMLFAVPGVFLIKTVLEVSHKSLKQFEII